MNASSFLDEAILGSNCLMEPAAILRGLANNSSPFLALSLFKDAKTLLVIKTSPSTVISMF